MPGQEANSKLVMYFTVNAAFVNYLDQITNVTESLRFPIVRNKTTFEQILPIVWNVSKFDSNLLTVPRNLQDFVNQYNCEKEIFYLQGRHVTTDLLLTKFLF